MHPTMTEHDFRFPRRPGDSRKTHRFDQAYDQAYTPPAPPATTTPTIAATATTTAAARMAMAAGMATSAAGPGALRPGLHASRLDPSLSLTHGTHGGGGAAHHGLLRAGDFPPFQQTAAHETRNLEEMQRQDPLATQIWRFYARTKQMLPAQERMENLTWRMMHVKLQRTRAAHAAVLYVPSFAVIRASPCCFFRVVGEVGGEEMMGATC